MQLATDKSLNVARVQVKFGPVPGSCFFLRCLAFGPSFKRKLCASKDSLKHDLQSQTHVGLISAYRHRSNCCGNQHLGFLILQFCVANMRTDCDGIFSSRQARWHTKNEMGGCGWSWPIKLQPLSEVDRLISFDTFIFSCSFGSFQAQSLLQTESQAGVNSWQPRFGLSSVLNL